MSAMKQPVKKSPRASKKHAAGAMRSSDRLVRVDGETIRCIENGRGAPVVVIERPGKTAPSALATLLAREFHVITFEIPARDDSNASGESGSARAMARMLDRAATAAGLERYVLVGESANAPAALWQAIERNERIEALILIAPKGLITGGPGSAREDEQDLDLEGRVAEIKAPTLLLLGANEKNESPETARAYARQIQNSYVVLVYDAGETIETERPQALLEALRDFVEQREKFVVNRQSSVINP